MTDINDEENEEIMEYKVLIRLYVADSWRESLFLPFSGSRDFLLSLAHSFLPLSSKSALLG